MFLPFSVPQRGQRTPPGAGGATAPGAFCGWAESGAPHVWQNAFCGGFSRWHWRHSMRRQWNRPHLTSSRSWRRS